MRTRIVAITVGIAALGLATASVALAKKAKAPAAAAGAPVDPVAGPAKMSAAGRASLKLYSDGKKHYVAVGDTNVEEGLFFYGSDDLKVMYQQRIPTWGSSGPGTFSFSFWEPRYNETSQVFTRDGNVFVSCGSKETQLKPLPEAESKKLLGPADLRAPKWQRQAYLLTRDDTGVYYFVDRQRDTDGVRNVRLYRGTKGQMKLLPMTNVVSDSQGDVFSTKAGNLRMIADKNGEKRDATWIAGKDKIMLTYVPVEDNVPMIYRDLGVYEGQLFGTPCDDFQ